MSASGGPATLSQLHNRSFGWLPQLPDPRDFSYAAMRLLLEAPATLPKSVNLRAQCPPIYDQGKTNACSANAVAGLLEFDRIKLGRSDFPPSRMFIYWNGRVLENSQTLDHGMYLRDGIKSVASLGYAHENLWPYDLTNLFAAPSAAAVADAKKYLALSYYQLGSLNEFKTCLAAGYPFVFGFTIYNSFFVADTNGGHVPMPSLESSNEGHAVMAVGYDDDNGYFTVRNSWGIGNATNPRGDGGYYYMPYQYLTGKLSSDFWTVRTLSAADTA